MDAEDTVSGNSRTPYRMVAMITVWVDDGQDHEMMLHAASQIVSKEIYEHIDGAGFKVGDTSKGFETEVESVEFILRTDLH
jgi:hypothetical protein